ncbi:DUF4351 domain-containing protein [Nocardia carnea]|uniref:DUF4351 domain-containing protein n=1 Tax=Nocardia carnea TaxID=37328 RepID=UPI002456F7E9|nr:DUF4351 domain-containing protein [Nocardia carnea]
MTAAERLRSAGWAEGRAEGRVEGETRMLLRLLAAEFGVLPAETVERVRSADTEELEVWTLRMLTAATIDEVFGPA